MKYDLILVDGSSYLFRAYHALPPLENSEGVPTGAIFGVLNMMRRLEKDYPDTKVIVVFDPKGGTFRHELYDQYKADRGAMPDDLAIQIPILLDIIVAMGYPLLIVPGYEADDVIASLVEMEKGHRILISTLDKDLAQLVTDKVHIINTMHNKLLDPEKVYEKFQVHPNQIRDYLALVGDKSDNIPGIAGVGPKTAAKWLALYKDVEGVKRYQHLLKGKVGETFRSDVSQIDLSYQLVTLVKDIDLGPDLDAIKGFDKDILKLKAHFKNLGFNRWLSELSEQKAGHSIEIRSMNAMKMILNDLSDDICLSYRVDKQHNALTPITSFCLQSNKKIFLIQSDYVDLHLVWHQLMAHLSQKTLIVYDAKLLVNDLARLGVEIKCELFDVMLAGYVVDSTYAQSLEKLSASLLDQALLLKKGDELKDILIKDVGNISKLYPVLKERIENNDIYHSLEMPLMFILSKMERAGILVDVGCLEMYCEQLRKEIFIIEQACEEILGEVINLASPKQLSEILFDKLGLPVIEKTRGGVASTGESVLLALKAHHPVIEKILQHRTLSKILSTYAEALPKQVMHDGRIHGCFNQAVTVTGRLSSMNPNLQNIPIRTKYGRKIRQAFIPKPGYVLLSADYSQVELRIMAHMSKDPSLIKAFINGEDVHKATAARIHQVSIEEVNSEQRRLAKTVNFGLIYGMSAFGLAKQLGIGRKEAQDLIERYFSEYPGVLSYMESIRKHAEEKAYVETLLGRKIMMPGARSKQSVEKQAAMRAAINAPMQGTASDIIKKAMIEIDAVQGFDFQTLLQVHDELLFEVKKDQLLDFRLMVKQKMEFVITLDVPLIVNVSSGDNWEKAHE